MTVRVETFTSVAASILAVVIMLEAEALEKEDMKVVVESVKEVCQHPSEQGSHWDVRIKGDGNARVKLIAALSGEAEFSKREWSGVQQVLREQQGYDSKNYRTCARELTPLFLEKFAPTHRSPPPGNGARLESKNCRDRNYTNPSNCPTVISKIDKSHNWDPNNGGFKANAGVWKGQWCAPKDKHYAFSYNINRRPGGNTRTGNYINLIVGDKIVFSGEYGEAHYFNKRFPIEKPFFFNQGCHEVILEIAFKSNSDHVLPEIKFREADNSNYSLLTPASISRLPE